MRTPRKNQKISKTLIDTHANTPATGYATIPGSDIASVNFEKKKVMITKTAIEEIVKTTLEIISRDSSSSRCRKSSGCSARFQSRRRGVPVCTHL